MRGSTGNRYNDEMSQNYLDFLTHQRISTGNKATLNHCANACTPSKSTIERNKPKVFQKMIPGVVYTEDYADWCKEKGYTTRCVIASDATAVETKISLDRTTEQLVGFVPKFVVETGLPAINSFPVQRPSQLMSYFNDPEINKADNINVILATPFQFGAESFPICVFPTDNSYKSEIAYNRNKFIAELLQEEGIEVVCTTTDADTKEKGGGKIHSEFGNIVQLYGTNFVYNPDLPRLVTIDTKHIVNSMKMRLFDSTAIRYFKDFPILRSDLVLLVSTRSKEVHMLNKSDISNNDKTADKMDKQSTDRICSWKVIAALESMENAKGTAFYLKLMRLMLDVFTDPSLSDKTRLMKGSYAMSCLRRWREQIRLDGGSANDFITTPAWESLEMNYAALVKLVQNGEGAKITLLSSQPVEQFFGGMRTQSTQGQFCASFNVQRGLELINNTHVKMAIEQKLSGVFNFPSAHKSHPTPHVQLEPLKPDEIRRAIVLGASVAGVDCSKLGIHGDEANLEDFMKPFKCNEDLRREIILANRSELDEDELDNFAEDIEMLSDDEDLQQQSPKTVEWKGMVFIDENTPGLEFKTLCDPNDPTSAKFVNKSYLLYLLDDGNRKKSLNRRERVQSHKRKEMLLPNPPSGEMFWKASGVELNDYVLVKSGQTFGIGRVVNFRQKRGGRAKKSSIFPYQNLFFDINENAEFNLFPFFKLATDHSLTPFLEKSYFEARNYIYTISQRAIDIVAMELNPQIPL